jgi:hypothetical protein
MSYGILKSQTNTGSDAELVAKFTTPLSVISNQPEYLSETASLRQLATSQNVQRWEIEANIAQSNDNPNMLVHTVANGRSKKVYLRMPQVYRPDNQKAPEGLSLVNSSVLASNTSAIPFTGNSGNVLPIGEFIKFSNHDKVYLIVDMNSGGNLMTIAPSLRKSVTPGVTISYGDKVTLTVRYDSATILGIKYQDGVLSEPGSMRFIEAL